MWNAALQFDQASQRQRERERVIKDTRTAVDSNIFAIIRILSTQNDCQHTNYIHAKTCCHVLTLSDSVPSLFGHRTIPNLKCCWLLFGEYVDCLSSCTHEALHTLYSTWFFFNWIFMKNGKKSNLFRKDTNQIIHMYSILVFTGIHRFSQK